VRLGYSTRTLLSVTLAGLSLLGIASGKKKKKEDAATMDEHKRAVHALNRLTFGARPGDVDRVEAMGVDKWIDQQLHPEKIDDSPLQSRLQQFPTLQMDSRELTANFPPEQRIKAVIDGKESMPTDRAERVVYQMQIDRYEQKLERKQAAAANPVQPVSLASAAGKTPADADTTQQQLPAAAMPAAEDVDAGDKAYADDEAKQLISMPPDQRLNAILSLSTNDRRALVKFIKGGQRDRVLDGMSPHDREIALALNNPQQVVTDELVSAKLVRAVYSDRQLQEVLTDFWFNHFNVFVGKGPDRYMLTGYERDAIRPYAMGKFEDLLVATAQSPAMLFYLDNWLSVGPNSDVANGIPKRAGDDWKKRERQPGPVNQSKGKRNGLNENYGRELMELHTLGVNGGYTQKDVTEVAKVLTGWTLTQPREGGGFKFDERMHEPGDKVVLGHKIKFNGEKEGYELLHILAHHPSTAKFICTKLAVRFVSDTPPQDLVDAMTQTFLKKDGDIREVMKTMLQSPEFWSPTEYRAKVKTPLEFTVSALRATGAELSDAMPVAHQLQNMGMPLYGMQPPTGYSEKSDAWVNSSALLGRMNFALAFTAGKTRGVQVSLQNLIDPSTAADVDDALVVLEKSFLAGDVSPQTHDTIAAQLQDPKITQRTLDDPKHPANIAIIAGLLLGSPEFQKR